MMTKMSRNRKNITSSLKQKLEDLDRLDKGESIKNVARNLNIGITTLNDWRKNKPTLQWVAATVELEVSLESRKTIKKPKLDVLDEAVWIWFNQERLKGTPLAGPLIKEKTNALNKTIDPNSKCTVSEGWWDKWKKLHGIHQVTVSGEKRSADHVAFENFIKKFDDIIKESGLTAEQIYNVDETRLNYKMLPQKTLASKQETQLSGFKLYKERITVAPCSNASGTYKLPLFVIGKSQKPRAFKNINLLSLSVHYRAQTYAC